MTRWIGLFLLAVSALLIGMTAFVQHEASAAGGCKWNGTSCGALNSCLTSWIDFGCTPVPGCDDGCTIEVKGMYGDNGPPSTPSGGWVECLGGAVVSSGTGAHLITQTLSTGCPSTLDWRFNHSCDGTGSDRCAAGGGGVIEAAVSGTCSTSGC